MPAWWGKKFSKSSSGGGNSTSDSSSPRDDVFKKNTNNGGPARRSSSDSATRLPRDSFPSSGSPAFSGFDSDFSAERKGHPLPRPSVSDRGCGGGGGGDQGSGSASGSVSSVSSTGSDEQHQIVNIDQQASFFAGGYRSPGGRAEAKTYMGGSRSPGPGSRSPVPGSRSPRPGSRSPGPRSRSPVPGSRPTSPLHPRLSGLNLDSPTGRGSEDGKSQCHPLPLPPTSPTSPSSSVTSTRSPGATEGAAATLSRWKKGKLLGRGTFGHVYLGFNSVNGQMCAIKEVRVVSDDQTSKECLKQLNQEINLLSQLSHPNIVRYHGSELSEETLSVYLEFVSGGSIHKLLQEYGAFKEPVIQNYTRQILSGLAYLHGRNTVHRDIKGANILVDPNGEIKLADFGMAKHITACSSMLSFKGSPYWMAPEVVMNTNGYSLAVDIWSLGCTILEMAAGKPPWSQYEGVAAIFKIGNSKDMPEIPYFLSDEAKSFIKLCLQRDPSLRPTASQLLDHPFLRDHAMRVPNSNPSSPYNFDGSRTPPALDLQPNRNGEAEYPIKHVITNVRATRTSRDDMRMITSLPVSPCSSPLRQNGPAHRSCFLSPPHLYPLMGQNGSGYNVSDFSLQPARQTIAPSHSDFVLDSTTLMNQMTGALQPTITRRNS
ncbi:Mitogen-activated protein kinase kinase kinase 3 [Linum grandiflorum]